MLNKIQNRFSAWIHLSFESVGDPIICVVGFAYLAILCSPQWIHPIIALLGALLTFLLIIHGIDTIMERKAMRSILERERWISLDIGYKGIYNGPCHHDNKQVSNRSKHHDSFRQHR
jgi:hypothetical protein